MKGENGAEDDLSEEEFKQPALPKKKRKAAGDGKKAAKKSAVLDLSASLAPSQFSVPG